MNPDDPLERAFAELRQQQAASAGSPLPPEELDALLDDDADPSERERLAAAVVASRDNREQLTRLLAVDAEIRKAAGAQRRQRLRRVGYAALACAAAAVVAVVSWSRSAPEAVLAGRILVAGVEPPKALGYPEAVRARPEEHLVLTAAPERVSLTWLALHVESGRSHRLEAPAADAVRVADLAPGVAAGVLFVAVTVGDAQRLEQTLRALVTPDVRDSVGPDGVGRGGVAVAQRLGLRLDRSTLGASTVLLVVEVF